MKGVLLCVVALMLSACGSSHEPKEQKDFKKLTSALSDEYEKVKRSGDPLGMAQLADRIKSELQETDRYAASWVGRVRTPHGDTYVTLANGDHIYTLGLFDAKAIQYAKTFEVSDEVVFNGNIGPVQNPSIHGALNRPRFYLHPTSFRKVGDDTARVQKVKPKLADAQRRQAN